MMLDGLQLSYAPKNSGGALVLCACTTVRVRMSCGLRCKLTLAQFEATGWASAVQMGFLTKQQVPKLRSTFLLSRCCASVAARIAFP